METIQPIYIDKGLVHKQKRENILLNNLRFETPDFIPKEVFEEQILPELSKEQAAFLKKNYLPINLSETPLPFMESGNSYYHFKSIMPVLTEAYLNKKKDLLQDKEMETILAYYKKDKKNGDLILEKPLKEFEQLKILSIFNEKEFHLTDSGKAHLSDILNKFDQIEKDDVYYSNMYVDTEHEFFFEHYCDHVPGMMIIESLRQFGIACSHKYGKIPLDGYQIMISDLEVQFKNYINFQYPIKMTARVYDKKCSSAGMWKTAFFELKVYQHSIESASIRYSGRSFQKEIWLKNTVISFSILNCTITGSV